jgi:hypothetical protein
MTHGNNMPQQYIPTKLVLFSRKVPGGEFNRTERGNPYYDVNGKHVMCARRQGNWVYTIYSAGRRELVTKNFLEAVNASLPADS